MNFRPQVPDDGGTNVQCEPPEYNQDLLSRAKTGILSSALTVKDGFFGLKSSLAERSSLIKTNIFNKAGSVKGNLSNSASVMKEGLSNRAVALKDVVVNGAQSTKLSLSSTVERLRLKTGLCSKIDSVRSGLIRFDLV